MNIDERVKIDELVKVYGDFLTDRQREIIDMYVDNNLSLSEVSEELNITRQAVKDALDKAVDTLNQLEQKVKFIDKKQKILDIINTNAISDEIKGQILKILEE